MKIQTIVPSLINENQIDTQQSDITNNHNKIDFLEKKSRKIYKANSFSTNESNFLNIFSSKEGLTDNNSHIHSNINYKKYRKSYPDKGNPQSKHQSYFNCKEKGKILFDNGNYYLGCLINDEANYFGIFYNQNQDIFKGFWKNEKADGLGFYESTEYKLLGEWEDNLLNGFGINFIKRNNLYFEGEFSQGKKNGYGILIINGGKYEGCFKEDEFYGIGSFYFKDERIYHGEWKNNKMHGTGLITWKNGNRYEGFFSNNKKNGFGIFYSDNKIYIGLWEESKLKGNVFVFEKGLLNKYLYEDGKKIKKLKFENSNLCNFLKNLIGFC